MPDEIHIVAPTLDDQTGHCFSHLESLRQANTAAGHHPLRAWIGARAGGLFQGDPYLHGEPYFRRPWHRLQTFWLYRRLLRQPGRVYVPTASRTDVLLLHWAAPGTIPVAKVFLLFHWLRLSEGKRRMLTRLAARQPHLVAMGPTPGVVELLQQCAFPVTRVVPYPITPARAADATGSAAAPAAFRHLLFAGAARADKGFHHVVALVEHLAATGGSVPLVVQVSPPHNGRHDADTRAALDRLAALRYTGLTMLTDTLDLEAYARLFAGAVCLQPYSASDYAGDRISGVTLDAFSAGCPVVATADTWMSRLADRFGAGRAVADLAPAALLAAVREVQAGYATFAERAVQAGRTLQQENSGARILEFIATYNGPA